MVRFDGKTEIDKGHLLYALMPFNNCITFFPGALYQGKRLLAALESNTRDSHDLVKLEEEFFVFALDRAIFYLKEICKSHPGLCEHFLKRVDEEIGLDAIKDVRDMRTHSNNYTTGTGKNKGKCEEKFFAAPQNLPIKATVDATSSIMINNLYLIGGRVDFHKTMQLLETISPEIEKTCIVKRLELLQKKRT